MSSIANKLKSEAITLLVKYKQLKISEYNSLYDIVVTKDSFLRKVKD